MINRVFDRTVISSGEMPTASFGISKKRTAHVMTILRDTLYADPIAAVIREYGGNAWDSHRVSGKADVPIKVTIPTYADPTLEIRDFGNGISHADVFEVFTQYGESTKGGSDEVVGYLGIGSKSGFAYGDSFTIVTYTSDCVRTRGHCSLDYVIDDAGVEHQISSPEIRGESCTIDHPHNHRRSYVAVLDDTERGEIRMMSDEECDPSDTGLSIQIPVKPSDIGAFNSKAEFLFQFYRPQPQINIDLPKPATVTEDGKPLSGYIVKTDPLNSTPGYDPSDDHTWIAVMGCIPYKIDIGQIPAAPHVKHLSGVLYFDIGELRVSASREALKYDDHTKTVLVAKIEKVVDDYLQRALLRIESESLWNKRLILNNMQLFAHVFPRDYAALVKWDVRLSNKNMGSAIKFKFDRIKIDKRSRIVVVNDRRSIKGFNLRDHDYLIRATGKDVKHETVMAEVNKLVSEARLDGIPIVKTADLPWEMEAREVKKNIKHRVKAFSFSPTSGNYYSPYSDYWEPIERTPTADDVYVVLDNFRVNGMNFYSAYDWDRKSLQALGLIPPIYGYRRRKGDNKHLGIDFSDWHAKVFEIAVKAKPEVLKLIEDYEYVSTLRRLDDKDLDKALEALGPDHPVSVLIARAKQANKTIQALLEGKREAVINLFRRKTDTDKTEAQKALEELYLKYPLFKVYSLQELWGQHPAAWLGYVRAMDKAGLPPEVEAVAVPEPVEEEE